MQLELINYPKVVINQNKLLQINRKKIEENQVMDLAWLHSFFDTINESKLIMEKFWVSKINTNRNLLNGKRHSNNLSCYNKWKIYNYYKRKICANKPVNAAILKYITASDLEMFRRWQSIVNDHLLQVHCKSSYIKENGD